MADYIHLNVSSPRGYHIFVKASVYAARRAGSFEELVAIRNQRIRYENKKKQDVSKCGLKRGGRCLCFKE